MSSAAVKQPPLEARSRFAHTTNHIMLVAAPPVLVALRALLDEIAQPTQNHESGRHDELLTELMYAIREDLGIKPNRAGRDFRFKLSALGQNGI